MPSSESSSRSLRPVPQDKELQDKLLEGGLIRSPYEMQNPRKAPGGKPPGQSQMPQLMPDLRQMPMPQMQTPGTMPPPEMRRLDANAGPILGWDVRNPAFASYTMPDAAAQRLADMPTEGGNAGALTAPTPTGPAPANPGVGSSPDMLALMRFLAQTGQNPASMYNPMMLGALQQASQMGVPAPAVGAGIQQGAPLSPLVLQALLPMLFSGGHMRVPQPGGAPVPAAPAPAPSMPMPAPVNPNLGGGGSFSDVVNRLLAPQQMSASAGAPSIDQMLQQAEKGQGQRSKYMEAAPIQQAPAPQPAPPAPQAPQGPGMMEILRQRLRGGLGR